MSLWLYVIRIGKFQEITHEFPIPGHIHVMLLCDCDFGKIEQVLRKHEHIYIPAEYGKLNACARHAKPFQVMHMDTKVCQVSSLLWHVPLRRLL